MRDHLGPLLALLALFFMHWKLVDLWYGTRGGLHWFWRRRAPSFAMMFSRATFLAAFAGTAMLNMARFDSLASTIAFVFGAHLMSAALLPDKRN